MYFAEIKKDSEDALPFVLQTVGSSDPQPPTYRPDGFRWHEFIWVSSGSGNFTVRDQSFILTEGKGVFIRKGIPHSYTGEMFHTRWCTFSSDNRLLDYMLGDAEYLLFDCPSYLEAETDSLIRLANATPALTARSAAGYSYVCDLLLKITAPTLPFETRVVEYLEAHYAEPITLADIAAAAGMDKYALCHAFKDARGESVMENLKKIRIAKARRLLRYGAESIAEVGRLCGFESASYFIRRFREECGCTPGEYRSRHSTMQNG